MRILTSSLILALSPICWGQYPAVPTDLTAVKSFDDVQIEFKETQICKQSSGSRTFSGYVHLPGSVLTDVGGYDMSMFFLYFEARNNPATGPLGIYLAGGAGESSTYTALSGESGPCYVNIEATDTTANPWSFNEHVNMLYIDQPVQSGFSYDQLVNATLNIIDNGLITPLELSDSPPNAVNASFGYGTFPSQKFDHTTKTTVQSAKALWHFVEHWLASFPGYQTSSKEISVWGNSYGGYWVPEIAAQFSRNLKALFTDHPLKSKCLAITSAGITNGCVDAATGISGWPLYAWNNTYDVRFGTKEQYETVIHEINKPNGFQALLRQCRELGEIGDPDFSGTNSTVNKVCMEAFGYFYKLVGQSFPKINKRDPFDIAQIGQTCPYYLPVATYLNTGSVQEELGVPLNFTYDSNAVLSNFGLPNAYTKRPISQQTGDSVRQDGLVNIQYLLANNVKVAFVFGDRDYRCPWTGGESTALAAKWQGQAGFAAAGYEELQGTAKEGTDNGAVTKQYGPFSFSRVFDAGHSVSVYAPETVYRIFERTVLGLDVATGKEKVGADYSTTGPTTSWSWRNELPETPPSTCIVHGKFQKKNPWLALES